MTDATICNGLQRLQRSPLRMQQGVWSGLVWSGLPALSTSISKNPNTQTKQTNKECL
jgi:hypothetical protein